MIWIYGPQRLREGRPACITHRQFCWVIGQNKPNNAGVKEGNLPKGRNDGQSAGKGCVAYCLHAVPCTLSFFSLKAGEELRCPPLRIFPNPKKIGLHGGAIHCVEIYHAGEVIPRQAARATFAQSGRPLPAPRRFCLAVQH